MDSHNLKARGIELSSGMEFQQFQKSVSSHLFALLSLEAASFSGSLSPHSHIPAAQQPSGKSVCCSWKDCYWPSLGHMSSLSQSLWTKLCALIGQA